MAIYRRTVNIDGNAQVLSGNAIFLPAILKESICNMIELEASNLRSQQLS